MEKEATARSVSIDLLVTFDESGTLNYAEANDLEPRERSQVREYVQNILRRRSYLDFVVDEFSSIKVEEMKPRLKNVLRLGLHELLFMGGTPDYATINESVELIKYTLGSKAGDLVNAILRNIQRDIKNLPKPAFKDRTKLVATTFSHPDWMVKRWVKRFGEREAFQLMQANNQRPNYYVRVNNLRTKTSNFKLRMEKLDIKFEESDWLPGYFKVDSVAPFISKGLLKKGICMVQDIAAGFAPTILEPMHDETIYDLCAAPGTKTIVMSDMMEATGSITAVDVNPDRLELLAQSAMDYHAENIRIRQDDVRELNLKLADGVLLDAPCTGTGVLSKRADLRWKRTEEELEHSIELQEELLDEAANHVTRGGRLVYSTCSIEPEENWDQIQKFLDKYDNYELEPLDEFLPEEVLAEGGLAYQTLPHKHGCDGHFGVRMKRVK